jgi:hypothetical protein
MGCAKIYGFAGIDWIELPPDRFVGTPSHIAVALHTSYTSPEIDI